MARDRYNFYFSFWATFYPLTPLKAHKIKIKKKKKGPGDTIILHVYQKS